MWGGRGYVTAVGGGVRRLMWGEGLGGCCGGRGLGG